MFLLNPLEGVALALCRQHVKGLFGQGVVVGLHGSAPRLHRVGLTLGGLGFLKEGLDAEDAVSPAHQVVDAVDGDFPVLGLQLDAGGLDSFIQLGPWVWLRRFGWLGLDGLCGLGGWRRDWRGCDFRHVDSVGGLLNAKLQFQCFVGGQVGRGDATRGITQAVCVERSCHWVKRLLRQKPSCSRLPKRVG